MEELTVQGHPWLHTQFQTSLGYVKHCLQLLSCLLTMNVRHLKTYQ